MRMFQVLVPDVAIELGISITPVTVDFFADEAGTQPLPVFASPDSEVAVTSLSGLAVIRAYSNIDGFYRATTAGGSTEIAPALFKHRRLF